MGRPQKYATREEYYEANRLKSKERYHRLQAEKRAKHPNAEKYKKNVKEKYHEDEKRIGERRESARTFKVDEDPKEYLQKVREKNRNMFDEILNDEKRWKEIFRDRDDVSKSQQNKQKYNRTTIDGKELTQRLRKLEEEFNLLEDKKGYEGSTYKNNTNIEENE